MNEDEKYVQGRREEEEIGERMSTLSQAISIPDSPKFSTEARTLGVPPTIGRILHWVDGEGKARAAVVVSEPDPTGEFWVNVLGVAGATVTGWQSVFVKTSKEDATGKEIGSWRYPPRV